MPKKSFKDEKLPKGVRGMKKEEFNEELDDEEFDEDLEDLESEDFDDSEE
jgi:hypothetical protein